MKYFFTLLFAFILGVSNAQNQIGNISFTDINGYSHSVHSYCNEGKTVVLYFYFVNCGICSFITPQLQEIYAAEGEDSGCLEVIACDVIPEDTASQIETYFSSHDVSFPYCAYSVTALTTFVNELPSMSTPGLLLIGPDKEIKYAGNGVSVLSDGPLSSLIEEQLTLGNCTASVPSVNEEIGIYPTLVRDQIYLSPSGQHWSSYAIYSMQGNDLYHYAGTGNLLDISALSMGYYLILAIGDNKVATQRFVKVK